MKRICTAMLAVCILFLTACTQTPAPPLSAPGTSQTTAADLPAETEDTDGTVADSGQTTGKSDKNNTKTMVRTTAAEQTKKAEVSKMESVTTSNRVTTSVTKKTRSSRTTTTLPAITIALPSARPAKPTQQKQYGDRIKVACVGDSITKNGYWNNLQKALDSRFTVQGFGVNGSTALYTGLDNGNPLAYVDSPEYRESLNSNADIVVIMLGTNDSKGYNWDDPRITNPQQFIIDYTDLVRSYQQLLSAPRVCIALPPTAFKAFAQISNDTIEKHIIPALKQVAADTGALLIDTHAANANASGLFTDGVHPSGDGGRQLLADAVAAVILKETGQ